MDGKIIRNEKAQLTIFVIIAMLIVVAILMIFLLVKGSLVNLKNAEDVRASADDCISKTVKDAEELIIAHGGYVVSANQTIRYDNEDIAYLCYTSNNNELCTNIEPMLIEKMQQEIHNYIQPSVESCFNNIKQRLGNNAYQESATEFAVEIIPENIKVIISKNISFVVDNEIKSIETFDSTLKSALYYFAKLSNSIINEEVNCDCGNVACNADVIKLNGDYTNFQTSRFVTGENEKVYSIKEFSSDKIFRFGVRNCVRLPY